MSETRRPARTGTGRDALPRAHRTSTDAVPGGTSRRRTIAERGPRCAASSRPGAALRCAGRLSRRLTTSPVLHEAAPATAPTSATPAARAAVAAQLEVHADAVQPLAVDRRRDRQPLRGPAVPVRRSGTLGRDRRGMHLEGGEAEPTHDERAPADPQRQPEPARRAACVRRRSPSTGRRHRSRAGPRGAASGGAAARRSGRLAGGARAVRGKAPGGGEGVDGAVGAEVLVEDDRTAGVARAVTGDHLVGRRACVRRAECAR